jgi:hypothetical protein
MEKSLLGHVCFSHAGMATFLQQFPHSIGEYNIDLAYCQCFHRVYVHIKFNTIVQLMDILMMDNP